MKRVVWTALTFVALVLSCGDTKQPNNTSDTNNSMIQPNNTSDTNNSLSQPTKQNSEVCACIWAGPVNYELATVSEVEGGVLVSASLEWRPCCASVSSGTRTWFIDWMGVSAVREAAHGAELPLPQDPMEPVRILSPTEDVELQISQRTDASITITELPIGVLRALPAGNELGEIQVDVSQ